jgi:hypothetical protein
MLPSWPGLSRPSTPCFICRKKVVDARDKPGHDGKSRHLFLNFGVRFSTKADMPSFWSSVANSE